MIIDTKIFLKPTFREGGAFTNIEAFLFLLHNCDEKGKLFYTRNELSKFFMWHRAKVYRFIDRLQADTYLDIVNGHVTMCLSNIYEGSADTYLKHVLETKNQPEKQPLEESKLLFNEEPIKEKKQPKKAPAKPKKESTALYSKMMALYFDWFKERNEGLPPNINAAEGVALKKIIAYFEPLVYNKAQSNGITLEKGSEAADNEVINAFKLIFNQWDSMDDFLKRNIKLSQINSNLTNIIHQLRNKNAKLTKQEQREAIIERDRQEWINIANKLNNLQ
jgi:hypothetical protein